MFKDVARNKSSAGPFVEDSDEDSVRTDTTAESEEQDDRIYNVDEVLAEDPDFEGSDKTKYLLRWTGYSIDRATWEPIENIETPTVLDEWKKRKRSIRNGEAKAFDLDNWNSIKLAVHEAREERARRRKLKRKKRGLPVSSSDEAYEDVVANADDSPKRRRVKLPLLDSDDEEIIAASSPVKRQLKAKIAVSQRKGIALKVTGNGRPVDSSADEDEPLPTQASIADSDLNSLFDEGSQPIYPDLEKPTAPPARSIARPPFIRAPTGGKAKAKPPALVQKTAGLAVKPSAPAPVPGNATGTAKRTSTKAGSSSATIQPRKQRPRVNGETSKEFGPKFVNLAQQNRFQKYSRNEPAPNQSALQDWDPVTGKFAPRQIVQASVASSKGPEDIHSVYGRQRSPPRIERQRSVTPPTREPARASEPQPNAASSVPVQAVSTIAPNGLKYTKTCWHWQFGTCRATATSCNYAHYRIDPGSDLPPFVPDAQPHATQIGANAIPLGGVSRPSVWAPPLGDWAPKKGTTCFYWLASGCKLLEEECQFAHRFTGNFPNRAFQEPELLRRVTNMKNTTCPSWKDGNCMNVEDTCKLAHRYVNNQQEVQLPPTPVDVRRSRTCFFWNEGNCAKGANCTYAHHWTGIVANPPPGHVGPTTNVQRGFEDHAPSLSTVSAPVTAPQAFSPTSPAKAHITCFFWQQGNCKNLEGTCPYAHRFTGVVAPPPPGYKAPFVPSPQAARNTAASSLLASLQGPPPAFGLSVDANELEASSMAGASSDHGFGPLLAAEKADPGIVQATIKVKGKGSSSANVRADLHVSGVSHLERLFYPVERGVFFLPDRMISAKDVEVYLSELLKDAAKWPFGHMVPLAPSRIEADALAAVCKSHAAGYISIQDAFTLLIFPTRDDEQWRFLQRADGPSVPGAPLRFQFLPPLRDVPRTPQAMHAHPPSSVLESASVLATKEMLGIDAERLLVEKDGREADKAVFFAWPQDHELELQMLARCFSDLGCKVYHSGTPGAWQYYKTNKSCLILCHPETRLWDILGLQTMLRNGSVRVFSLGLQPSSRLSLDDPAAYACQRLFPIGRVTFITDDVFVHHPEKAAEVIDQFLYAHKYKPAGAEHDKIATRPGIKDWLRELAIERTSERGRHDDRWLKLYYEICELCPLGAEDVHDPPNPAPDALLVSFPPEELPSFVGLWEQQPEKATDVMVEWFAGWAVMNANKFRKFVVCHEPQKGAVVMDENGRSVYQVEADPRGWAKRWHHVDVLRPEQILKPKSGK